MAYVNAVVTKALYLVFASLAFRFARTFVISSSKTPDTRSRALAHR